MIFPMSAVPIPLSCGILVHAFEHTREEYYNLLGFDRIDRYRDVCTEEGIGEGMISRFQISLVAGARPNFMKIAPLVHALSARKDVARAAGIDLSISIVHTGQHYDANMSDVFFRELEIPTPDRHLDVGPGSHAEQTAKIMVAFEKVLLDDRPDIVVVVGDVNSTVALCADVEKAWCEGGPCRGGAPLI